MCSSGVENPFAFNPTYILILIQVSSTGRDILTQKSLPRALRHQNATCLSDGVDVPVTKCKMYVALSRRVDLGRVDALIPLPGPSANSESWKITSHGKSSCYAGGAQPVSMLADWISGFHVILVTIGIWQWCQCCNALEVDPSSSEAHH